jgi:hypothetical protein
MARLGEPSAGKCAALLEFVNPDAEGRPPLGPPL